MLSKINKVALFFFSEVFIKIIPLLVIPLYLAYIGLAGYGEMAFFSALISLFVPIISLTYNNIIIKRLHDDGQAGIEFGYFILVLISSSLIFVGGLFALSIFTDFDEKSYFLCIVLVAVLAAAFLAVKDLFIHLQLRKLYSIFILIHTSLVHVINLILINYNNATSDFWWYRFLGESFSLFFCLFLSFMFLPKECRPTYKVISFVDFFKKIKLSVTFLPRNCMPWYRTVVERKYIILFIDDVALGIYTVIYQLSSALIFPFHLVINFNAKNIISKVQNAKFSISLFFVLVFFGVLLVLLGWFLIGELFVSLMNNVEYMMLEALPYFFVALVLSFISNYLLSLTVHAGVATSNYNFVYFTYIAIPLFLLILRPDDLFGVALCILSINILYLSIVFCIFKRSNI